MPLGGEKNKKKRIETIHQQLTVNGNLCQNVVCGNGTYVKDKDETETLVYAFKGGKKS